jgi:AraC-like DNA-binding protein
MSQTFAQEDRHMEYSKSAAEPIGRSNYWRKAVSDAFFPLDTIFREEDSFDGDLKNWSLGLASLARLRSDAILYKRSPRQVLMEREKTLLITVPELAEVSFEQCDRETRCAPGGFLIERGDAPYEFQQSGRNSLWVLKVPSAALRARVGPPERFSALSFDATQGVGAYFLDKIRFTAPYLDDLNMSAKEMVGQQLIDLLCLAIQNDERVLDSNMSSVRAAHLFRAEQHIRQNLAKGELQPQDVADACGISLRYLQRLFTDSGRSIYEWIREQRLLMCDEELRKGSMHYSISEIAYRWGFADQSQFSKNYRMYFGRSPSQARTEYRLQSPN